MRRCRNPPSSLNLNTIFWSNRGSKRFGKKKIQKINIRMTFKKSLIHSPKILRVEGREIETFTPLDSKKIKHMNFFAEWIFIFILRQSNWYINLIFLFSLPHYFIFLNLYIFGVLKLVKKIQNQTNHQDFFQKIACSLFLNQLFSSSSLSYTSFSLKSSPFM